MDGEEGGERNWPSEVQFGLDETGLPLVAGLFPGQPLCITVRSPLAAMPLVCPAIEQSLCFFVLLARFFDNVPVGGRGRLPLDRARSRGAPRRWDLDTLFYTRSGSSPPYRPVPVTLPSRHCADDLWTRIHLIL